MIKCLALLFVSLFFIFPITASAATLSSEKCDVGFLEVEGSTPSLNREWIPQVGVTFMNLNGSKSRSHGFVPGSKTKFNLYLQQPGSSDFKKVDKKSYRYKTSVRYRGSYMTVDKKYLKKSGRYTVKTKVEGNKLPAGILECSSVFSFNVQ